MAIGSSKINFSDIVHYVTGHTDTKATFLLHNVRMPRMIAGLFIGGALAVSGLLMQAMTRNPLASPKIFGVSSGASFVIVLVTIIIPSLEYYSLYFRCHWRLYWWINCLHTFWCYKRYDAY